MNKNENELPDYRFDFELWLKSVGAWEEFYKYANFELLNGPVDSERLISRAFHGIDLSETDSGFDYWVNIQEEWKRVLFRPNMIKLPLPKEKVSKDFVPKPLKLAK